MTAALTALTHEHWDRYSQLFAEVRASGEYVRPQSRARTLLAREYRARLRALYLAEVERLAALPEADRVSVRPRFKQVRPTRVNAQTPRVLEAITAYGEIRPVDLGRKVDLSQASLAYQLRKLIAAGRVSRRYDGTAAYYSAVKP